MAKWPMVTKWPSATVSPGAATPNQLISSTTFVEWWRADSANITVATGVSQWTGKLNSLNVTQATGANQPLFTAADAAFNGYGSVTGDGTNDSLDGSLAIPFPGTQARYYWFIFRSLHASAPAANGNVFCGKTNNCEAVLIFNSGSGGNAGKYAAYNSTASTALSVPLGIPRLGEAYFSNSANDFFRIGPRTSQVSGVSLGNTQDGSGWGMFSHGAADGFWNGAIAELIILNAAPTEAERSALQAYAVDRYSSIVIA